MCRYVPIIQSEYLFLKLCTIRTKRHMHFIHSYIKNVSVWDPTAHFKYF